MRSAIRPPPPQTKTQNHHGHSTETKRLAMFSQAIRVGRLLALTGRPDKTKDMYHGKCIHIGTTYERGSVRTSHGIT